MGVTAHFIGRIERLGDYKMEVSVLCVTENDAIGVSVAIQNLAKVMNGLRQSRKRDGHVFNDHARSRCPTRSDCGKDPFANFPKLRLFFGIRFDAIHKQSFELRKLLRSLGLAREME